MLYILLSDTRATKPQERPFEADDGALMLRAYIRYGARIDSVTWERKQQTLLIYLSSTIKNDTLYLSSLNNKLTSAK